MMQYLPMWKRRFACFSLLFLWVLLVTQGAQAERMYAVRAGDTWSRIAKRFHISAWDLAKANRTSPKKQLRAGQDLLVPSRFVTYVRRGQTLSKIARAHDCSVSELRRINRLGKRGLRAGARLKLPGYSSTSGRRGKRDYGKPERPGVVTVVVKDERASIALVDEQGRVRDQGLQHLAQWMHRNPFDVAKWPTPHPRLGLLLANISDHFGGRAIHLYSGFRSAGGRTKGTSRHVQGRAVDIQVQGVPKRVLFDYCRSLGNTGCGYYPRSLFVHVDAREKSGQWVDWSRPGRRARYGIMRRPYRRRERRSPKRPRVTRRVTRPDAVPLHLHVVDVTGAVRSVWDGAPDQVAEATARAGGATGTPDKAM